MAAEAGDPDLEGDPGPVRRLLEEHRHMLAGQGPLSPLAGLDPGGQLEHGEQLAAVEVGQAQEVAAVEGQQRVAQEDDLKLAVPDFCL